MAGATYQVLSEVERTLVDICRMGLAGDTGGMRSAASRLVRKTPGELPHPEAFRQAVGQALTDTPYSTTLLRRAAPVDVPTDVDTAMALAIVNDLTETDEPILNESTAAQVQAVLSERVRRDELLAVGLQPSRSMLMVGPPGVGKTMTARYVAQQIGLPLVTIDLATVMSSYLGRTGQNLREALRYGRERSCVVFIDEFDALAKRRDDDSDIGELKRLVNVLLLELERWSDDQLLLAATNHPELLDRAVARRFDRIVEFSLPDDAVRDRLFEVALGRHGGQPDHVLRRLLVRLSNGLSGSDIDRLVTAAARRSVLETTTLDSSVIDELIKIQPPTDRALRDSICVELHDRGWPQRRIAEVLNVSHPTVGAAIKREKATP